MQFISGNRENIVCRKDGTLRHSEPSAGENLSCIIPFVLIYYFLMAAMVWFAIFTYAWHLQTTDRGNWLNIFKNNLKHKTHKSVYGIICLKNGKILFILYIQAASEIALIRKVPIFI